MISKLNLFFVGKNVCTLIPVSQDQFILFFFVLTVFKNNLAIALKPVFIENSIDFKV